MVSVKSRPYIAVLLHVFSWLLFAFVLLFYQPLSWDIIVPYQFWIKQGCILLMLIAVFYTNSHFLVPQLLLRSRTILFVLVILVLGLLSGPLIRIIDEAMDLPSIMTKAFGNAGFGKPPRRMNLIDVFLLMMTLFMVGISTSVTLIQKWQEDRQLREALEKEKIGSELLFLKAQINPHFFFNTLNNIYALTHVDVDNSRRALHKLSRMMRYILYETQSSLTPLSRELDFIADYVELMKLRLGGNTTVVFEPPSLEHDPQIAPMLFLPYIENAFKYGTSGTEPAKIFVSLKVNATEVVLTVVNKIFNNGEGTADEYGGIGLTNTRRRLELVYPGRHSVVTRKKLDSNEFVVELKLNLDGTELYSSR